MKIEEMERERRKTTFAPDVKVVGATVASFPEDIITIDRGSGLEYFVVTSDGRYVPVEDWWG